MITVWQPGFWLSGFWLDGFWGDEQTGETEHDPPAYGDPAPGFAMHPPKRGEYIRKRRQHREDDLLLCGFI